MKFEHQPVLLEEVSSQFNPESPGVYVDCTLGGGGHSEAILKLNVENQVIGIDQDPSALSATKARLATYAQRVTYVHANFRNLDLILEEHGIALVDGILMDIGVSSPQLDQGERGFSYQHDAHLDMRMDPTNPTTAFDLVNKLSEDELTKIIQEYGEERWAKRIAKFIVEYRQDAPVKTTSDLVSIIKAAIPKGARIDGPHPAKRTFQALRIAVNDELGALEVALGKAIDHLKPNGRLCVITFHSLEDRLVKNTFRRLTDPCTCPIDLPVCICDQKPVIKLITRKPITASKQELELNPRARSAKLRVCERLP